MMTHNPVLAVVALVGLTSAAYGDYYCFDFNALCSGDNASTISTYMTNIYGSSVTVEDATVKKNSRDGYPDWNGNSTDYIWTSCSSDFEISFDNCPIRGVKFNGYVFDATSGPDFQIFAYTSAYTDNGGTREDPNSAALVYQKSWYSCGGPICTNWICFDQCVSLLVFSDHCVKDIGIDNLCVKPCECRPIPAPGALLLGVIGLGMITGVRRRPA